MRQLAWVVLLTGGVLGGCGDSPGGPAADRSYAWQTSSPAVEGLDPQALKAGLTAAGQLPFVNSVLVVRHGRLVAERYYNGHGRNDAHNVRSVSKSFVSALVGIAFRERLLLSLEQQALDFFPEQVSREIDPQKRLITLRHLLRMQAGFDHDHNTFGPLRASADWVAATFALPLLFAPGERFSYNTFETHLLSAILTRATGTSTLVFAESYLLEPLDIALHDWTQDPQGVYFGGTDMFFTPRDLARFGQLYLDRGRLDGEQIVPADWVDASLTGSVHREDWSWGAVRNLDYGYLWWLGEISGQTLFFALGHGGQFVLCFPELDMVAVTASASEVDWDRADQQERAVLEWVRQHLLPAVIDR